MRVLIGMECSGRVRRAFRALGHDAWSCDLKPAEDDSPFHLQGDVLDHLEDCWDLAIFHPDCTHHVGSGARWFKETPAKPKPGVYYGADRVAARDRDRLLVLKLWQSRIPKVVIENPVGSLGVVLGPPTQIVQPWWFGDPAIKTTCLWMRGVEKLARTSDLEPPADPARRQAWQACWRAAPSAARKANRARTYPGLAAALAQQLGGQLVEQEIS